MNCYIVSAQTVTVLELELRSNRFHKSAIANSFKQPDEAKRTQIFKRRQVAAAEAAEAAAASGGDEAFGVCTNASPLKNDMLTCLNKCAPSQVH
jgi:hypothetical protein